MIEVAIVEDEDAYASQLEAYIKRFEEENDRKIHVTRYRDGADIAEDYKGCFDIILMDIQMQFMDGMKAAEEIRRRDEQVVIMFITNRIDYALRGYQVDAVDYVVKPVEYFMFSQKLARAISRIKKEDVDFIVANTREESIRIPINEICFIEAQGHTLLCHMEKQTVHSFRGRLQELEEKLKGYGFFRCHKGYLVNIRYVEASFRHTIYHHNNI